MQIERRVPRRCTLVVIQNFVGTVSYREKIPIESDVGTRQSAKAKQTNLYSE